MTFRKSTTGLFWWKSYKYELLLVDTDAFFILHSKFELAPADLDILFMKIIKVGVMRGEVKTEKGKIKFKLNNVFKWLDDSKKDEA